MPRAALLLAVPVVALVVGGSIGVSLGLSRSERDDPATTPTLTVVSSPQAETTAVLPTATPLANRTDCAAMRGTDYRSLEERDWYRQNCVSAPSIGSDAGASGGSSGSGVSSPAPAGVESYLGDRLVIPAAGVDAFVNRIYVDPGVANLPNPSSYFSAVWYDLSAFPGYGGYVEGNMVIAGHVDCAACHNGSPGIAVFYYIRNLRPGDTIDYYTADGKAYRYVVNNVVSYPKDVNILPLVASDYADMTLITCVGNWDASLRQYSDRLFVFATKT